MHIQELFARDINRHIDGVIKVEQAQAEVVAQEIEEYVITKELYEYFGKFFEQYCDTFDCPTDNCGVWISGFFGSGKSHFLKMLSYLLSNKVDEQGKSVLERFETKFREFNDSLTWSYIQRAVEGRSTETILFNIQSQENSAVSNKERNPVLDVFAKVFFKHLGYYGDNLQVVRLEQFLQKEGKYQEFEKAFAELDSKHRVWRERRCDFKLLRPKVEQALQQVMGYTREEAKQCLDASGQVGMSVEGLAEEVKQYIQSQAPGFRLVFLLDEVGQFVAEHIDYLLTLQTIVEKLGAVCRGRVWVICTAQDKLDDIKKNIRQDEFSKIAARFPIRLNLTSSAAREVIEKRVLAKSVEAEAQLVDLYHHYEGEMRNLFAFSGVRQDVLGYTSSDEFVRDYPFVPYQFNLIKDVFVAIRKHSNSGKHMSGGERSMLSGFQESAQAVQQGELGVLSPFVKIYDTIKEQLDSKVREVINRCQVACDNHQGLHPGDAEILKLLYLVRYIDGMPANEENILTMTLDNLHTDKLVKRQELVLTLDRLVRQNYVAKVGDCYQFLTDLEQDIQREIDQTLVAPEALQGALARIVKQEVFKDSTKHKYCDKDFDFNIAVDESNCTVHSGSLGIKLITPRCPDYSDKFAIMAGSFNGVDRAEAAVVLGDDDCMSLQERILKIKQYLAKHTKPTEEEQVIFATYREEMTKLQSAVSAKLGESIRKAEIYVNGSHCNVPKASDARAYLKQVLDILVKSVYTKINMVDHSYTLDDIETILKGGGPINQSLGQLVTGEDIGENCYAFKAILEDLEIAKQQNLKRTVYEVKTRLLGCPFGWKELDVTGLLAELWANQEVRLKHGGEVITPDAPNALDFISRKEIKSTYIQRRKRIDFKDLGKVREYITRLGRSTFSIDEDSVYHNSTKAVYECYKQWQDLSNICRQGNYPGQDLLSRGVNLAETLIESRDDIDAFMGRMLEKGEDLCEVYNQIGVVEQFFSSRQREIFDNARQRSQEIAKDREWLSESTWEQLGKVRELIELDGFDFSLVHVLRDKFEVLQKLFKRDWEARCQKLKEEIAESQSVVDAGAQQVLSDSAVSAEWRDKALRLQAEFAAEGEQLCQEAEHTESINLLNALAYKLLCKRDNTLRDLGEKPAEAPAAVTVAAAGASAETPAGMPADTIANPSAERATKAPDDKLASAVPSPVVTGRVAQSARQKTCNYKCPTRIIRNKSEAEVYLSQVRRELLQALEQAEQVEIN